MSEIKVGDKVRVVKYGAHSVLLVEAVGVVTGVETRVAYPYEVVFEEDIYNDGLGASEVFNADEIERVEEDKEDKEDKVKPAPDLTYTADADSAVRDLRAEALFAAIQSHGTSPSHGVTHSIVARASEFLKFLEGKND